MSGEAKKTELWRRAVVIGAALVFVLGIPSLPGGHHQHSIYWAVAFVVEAVLCATLLPWRRG